MTILEWAATSEQSSWGVREIGRGIGLAPSSVYRILAMLGEVGVVQREEETGRYSLTLNFFQLASRIAAKVPVRETAAKYLRELADSTCESVYLARYGPEQQAFMFVDHIPATHPLRYEMPLYEWMDLRVGAGGLGILAFLRPEARRAILDLPGPTKLTEFTVTDRDLLTAELDRFCEQGYAVSVGRRVSGVAGIAAPIVNSSEEVVGAVVLAMPEPRFADFDLSALAESVVITAQAVSLALGAEQPGTIRLAR